MLLLRSTGANGLGAAPKHTLLPPRTLPCSFQDVCRASPMQGTHGPAGSTPPRPAGPCANSCRAGEQGTAGQGKRQIKNNNNNLKKRPGSIEYFQEPPWTLLHCVTAPGRFYSPVHNSSSGGALLSDASCLIAAGLQEGDGVETCLCLSTLQLQTAGKNILPYFAAMQRQNRSCHRGAGRGRISPAQMAAPVWGRGLAGRSWGI